MAPQRTCVGCGRRDRPIGWTRVARRRDGSLAIGPVGPGRGAWLCDTGGVCATAAVQRGRLTRALRGPVDGEIEKRLRSAHPGCANIEPTGDEG